MRKKIYFALVAASISLTMAFVSCEKNEIEKISTETPPRQKTGAAIPFYTDIDEIHNIINYSTSTNSISELMQYEREIGIESIGAIADFFYSTINITDFSNVNDVLNFYSTHTTLLDTTSTNEHELVILPKLFHTPYRYVANQDCLFGIGTTIYKVFDSCIVAVPASNLQSIYSLTEDNIDTTTMDIFCFTNSLSFDASTHPGCINKLNLKNTPNSDNDRIYIELKTHCLFVGPGEIVKTTIDVYNLHKWARVWWTSRHTLTCQGNVTIHSLSPASNSWEYNNIPVSKSSYTNKLHINVAETQDIWPGVNAWNLLFQNYKKFYHYRSFNLSAWYPEHSVEYFSMN